MDNQHKILESLEEKVKRNHHLIKPLIILLSFFIVIQFVRALTNHFLKIMYEETLYSTKYTYSPYYGTLNSFNYVVEFLAIVGILIIGILFIVWFSRAYYNISRYQLKTRFSPILSSISWFIPIVSLFIPLLIMKDLIQQSEKFILKKTGKRIRGNLDLNIVNSWWGLYLVASIIPILKFVLLLFGFSKSSLVQYQLIFVNAFIINIITAVAYILSGIILIIILVKYKALESEMYELRYEEDF